MEAFLVRAAQLILSLAILVLLHEFGHFLFARLFKVRVDKFYMFFNPNFSLIRAKKIEGKWNFKFFAKNVLPNERIKLDENGNPMMDGKNQVMEQVPTDELPLDDWRRFPETTEWGIGWLPLGGYCKISGMIDESMDKTQMSMPAQPWEFRSRSVWQRLPIIIGGVFVNFVLALVIYSAVLFTWGKEYIPLENAKYGFHFSKTMTDIGFQNGDKILKVDTIIPNTIEQVSNKIIFDDIKTITVQRNENVITINIPSDIAKRVLRSQEAPVDLIFPFVVDSVLNNSIGEKAKIQKGDSIIGINNTSITSAQDVLNALKTSKNKTINIVFVRNGIKQSTTAKLDQKGEIGVKYVSPFKYLDTKHDEYSFWASIPAGIKLGVGKLVGYVKQLKFFATKEGLSNLGGFGTMGKLFSPVWDWQSFWMMTAFISVILAFMNLLPIPGLDGGYVIFLIYEMITGKKPSEKFMENAVTVGFFLLVALMLYANGNDIFKAIKEFLTR